MTLDARVRFICGWLLLGWMFALCLFGDLVYLVVFPILVVVCILVCLVCLGVYSGLVWWFDLDIGVWYLPHFLGTLLFVVVGDLYACFGGAA